MSDDGVMGYSRKGILARDSLTGLECCEVRSTRYRLTVSVCGIAMLAFFTLCAAGELRVSIEPARAEIQAEFRLSRPVSEFGFEPSGAPYRSRTWRATTAGLRVESNAVLAMPGQEFDRFSLAIDPDDLDQDRSYPALTRIGEAGFVIYAPYLRGAGDDSPIVSVSLPAGYVCVPRKRSAARALPSEAAVQGEGYVFIGPSDYVTHRGRTHWVSGTVPSWMMHDAQGVLPKTMSYYQRRLRIRPQAEPLIVMTLDASDRTTWRGDVTAGPVMALRFRGPDWTRRSVPLSDVLARFVAHESYHFWNSILYSSDRAAQDPWLHEGAAEFAALVALNEQGVLSAPAFLAALQDDLNLCRDALGMHSLVSDVSRSRAAVYGCGTVVQWIVDRAALRASGGRRDVFTIWKEIFEESARHGGRYDVADFLSAAARQSSGAGVIETLDRLLFQEGDGRWSILGERLASLGVDLKSNLGDERMRSRVLMHILSSNCSDGRFGFWTSAEKRIRLDAGPNCGALAGSPLVSSIEGHDLLTDIRGAYEAVRQRCAAGNDVAINTVDPVMQLTARCRGPMAGAEEFHILAVRPARRPRV